MFLLLLLLPLPYLPIGPMTFLSLGPPLISFCRKFLPRGSYEMFTVVLCQNISESASIDSSVLNSIEIRVLVDSFAVSRSVHHDVNTQY